MSLVLRLLVALTLCFSPLALADEGAARPFLKGKAEGWFWYDDPKDAEPEKKEEKPPVAPVVVQKSKDEPFSVNWLRTNLPKLLDQAIDEPSKENVEAFYYAQRVMMDKAQRYSEAARTVVTLDPLLDENNRVPVGTMANKEFLLGVGQSNDDAIRELSQKGGLWVFFDSKCSWCRTQVQPLYYLTRDYGFSVRYISMDGKGMPGVEKFFRNQGQAEKLGIKITPTTVLVVPPNNYYILSQGMMSTSEIKDRIVIAGKEGKLFSEAAMQRMGAYQRGVLTTSDLKNGASDDPKEWVARLKQKIMGGSK